MSLTNITVMFQQVPSLDLSENMSSDLMYAAADLNGTTVQVPRTETRRNRSCRATGVAHDSHSRSHSRHRNVRARDKSNDRRDLSVLDDHVGDGKENFIVPCTPKTPRQKQRPSTVGASPPRSYQRTPSSPPACLTTTLPASSEISYGSVIFCSLVYLSENVMQKKLMRDDDLSQKIEKCPEFDSC